MEREKTAQLEEEIARIKKELEQEKKAHKKTMSQKVIAQNALHEREMQIERMLNWKSMRLGKAILNCNSLAGIMQLPSVLWSLRTKKRDIKPAPKIQKQSIISDSDKIIRPRPQSEDAKKWYDSVIEKASKIADSNGCRYYEKSNLKIGLICDEFFYDSIKDAANFIYVTPKNWKEKLDEGLDAFLYVSTWKGLNGEWKGATLSSVVKDAYAQGLSLEKIQEDSHEDLKFNKKQIEIFNILNECHSRNIPTIFYSKEDPPNFWIFLGYAKKCDYIFTSAKECVDLYKEQCPHSQVNTLNFCVNPLYNNPIGIKDIKRTNDVIFAGSWMEKYEERCDNLLEIFDGVKKSGHNLYIFDRNSKIDGYEFPSPYNKLVLDSVKHNLLQKIYKTTNWAININSIKKSETMFANRVFELLANGSLILSNFSVGINSLLPNVFMMKDSTEISEIMSRLTSEEIYERQIAGVRSVMTGHTCFDRLSELLHPLNLSYTQPERCILVVADNLTDQVKTCFKRQTYPNKVLRSSKNISEEDFKSCSIVAYFSENADYEEFYLEDMANAFKFTSSDYITKDAWLDGEILQPGIEHGYVDEVKSKYRSLFWRDAFSFNLIVNMPESFKCANGYSSDHFNYNQKIISKSFSKQDYKLSVIVPIYNNGYHLYGKCFSSLRRSSMFTDMEIILVDDGSTDNITKKIETWLTRHYSNVKLFCYERGGSGSASRPRNKGVELATAKYLTFLDPDNEAVCDGYSILYNDINTNDYDLVLGNMYRYNGEFYKMDYFSKIQKSCKKTVFDGDCFTINANSEFTAFSIQAMIAKKNLITSNNIYIPEGALGQDTLMGWQLVHYARSFHVLNHPVHIYYAATAGSVTNSVTINFFKKLLLLQEPKLKWLLASNNIEEFMKKRYDYYTYNWILKKLSFVREEDAIDSVKIAYEIHKKFAPYYNYTHAVINKFANLCNDEHYTESHELLHKLFTTSKLSMEVRSIVDKIFEKKTYISYSINGTNVTFINNKVNDQNLSYCWVIRTDKKSYEKIYQTPYTDSNKFEYDFSTLKEGKYKIRTFIKTNNVKQSEDIALISITSDKKIKILII